VTDRICIEPGCGLPHSSRGLCQRHHQMMRRSELADPVAKGRREREVAELRAARKAAICSVLECGRPFIARGYCHAHWRRWRDTGDAAAATPLRIRRGRGSTQVRDEQGRKECGTCRQWLPLSEFTAWAGGLDGMGTLCTPCARARWRRRVSNLSEADYQLMVAKQGGRCAICKRSDNPGRRTWYVDHDHACCSGAVSCGKCVRGLLCANCNAGLGMFKDSPEALIAALDYLKAGADDHR
jgi:hypothetical protein